MRETRSYGSVRGVRSNPYPYRDRGWHHSTYESFEQSNGARNRSASHHLSFVFTSSPAQRIGTAKFEPPKLLRTAKVTPITLPSRLKNAPPEPPQVVAAS